MTKARQSKLDQYAERLDEWFLGGKTLQEAQQQLKLDGCLVSLSRLSDWWSHRQRRRQEEMLLGQIANGARQAKEVEAQFGKNPPPEVETIIKLQRVLIMQLSTQAQVQPELIELVARLTKPSMEYAKLIEKRREIEIAERKVKLLEEKAKQADDARAVVESELSAEEKQTRIKQIFGMG